MESQSYGMVSAEKFQEALVIYEALSTHKSTSESPDAELEAQTTVEKLYPGFRLAYERYLEASQSQVYDIPWSPAIKAEANLIRWYSGPKQHSGQWQRYKARLTKRIPQAVVDIDRATSEILGMSANPLSPGSKRKGLVLGQVQSGKTANYAALIAKAVDAGYRIIIVLAGMHTNLRRQTQTRLRSDLGFDLTGSGEEIKAHTAWVPLTTDTADLGTDEGSRLVNAFSSKANTFIMIVKKNERRLQNVVDFLTALPDELLRSRAVMIVDDESDQATPNTQARKNAVSTINRRVRDIWQATLTGTYLAFTATPFANIFIDPKDEDDLYPDDFIYALPRPSSYLGAREIFDIEQTVAGEDGDSDIQADVMVTQVSPEEAESLTPRDKDLYDFAPIVGDDLGEAVRWFILGTAVRRIREDRTAHSSMLVHTSHRIHAHGVLADSLENFVQDLAFNSEADGQKFQQTFENHRDRSSMLPYAHDFPEWAAVWEEAKRVLSSTKIVIDNGQSEKRLEYPDNEPQTVIVVGGGTLSRGLTLEGLISSYFLRTSNTYDTLLQMGRWFGYRPGYEDLVRVWVGPGLLDDFVHLARVEDDLRAEIEQLQEERKTPREFAVKVRGHSGRLKITAPNKMSSARLVSPGLGNTRRQTIYLDKAPEHARRSMASAIQLAENAISDGREPRQIPRDTGDGDVLFEAVDRQRILEFFREYWVSAAEPYLQHDSLKSWTDQFAPDAPWNVVFISSGRTGRYVDLPGGMSISPVRRTRLGSAYWEPESLGDDLPAGSDVVNIRALMSGGDVLADLAVMDDVGLLSNDSSESLHTAASGTQHAMLRYRARQANGAGLLAIYIIDKDSQPQGPKAGSEGRTTRTSLDAETDLVGVGVVFPTAHEDDRDDFYSVITSLDADEEAMDESDLLVDDSEEDSVTESVR